ncbi:acyl CoA:acetate/3-ketoacid CoA transferase [Paenibacillus xerothermodurans]|uniref:Acyl CoA:acetate/3-ketoacid CoA transferase n=1 Tax=Paenibacillus xerothermodurans TaxID=1977292 RepID=A0A2W1NDB7_PAEXE|nr:CoA-transferase [Paenibacillus xerothermodurans]PZE21091.1 acyl CoA:acetate/3-ketoacid CoA transferase [Paenibacillus xerothermodurans]
MPSPHTEAAQRSKVMSAQEAAEHIPDGATVAIGGLISILCPEKVIAALGSRYDRSGSPTNLTVVTPVRVGWDKETITGLDHLAKPGMMKRLISGSFNVKESPKITDMIRTNAIEAYSFSMGTLFHLMRNMAGGNTGMFTKAGLHTYVDPRVEGGRLNERTTANINEVVTVAGQEYLYYHPLPVDVAVIRGTTVDEDGNVSLEHEPVTLAGLEMAMAAKANGGFVIVQAKRLTARGSMHPRAVTVPGILVDAIVIDPEQRQSLIDYNPSWTGEVREPADETPHPIPLDARKIILRRAAEELPPGSVVNLGVGIPVSLPQLLLEQNRLEEVTFSLEHGAIGGIPMGEEVFGAHRNPTAFFTSPQVFDYYHSGCLSATLLGFAQIDGDGNVNVSKFNGIFRGSGGFIDITHSTKKILFCGTLTSGGLALDIRDGRLSIIREGRHKKLIRRVEHLTFSAHAAREKQQEPLYITERAVFRLGAGGLVLTEYAPGIDIEREILPLADCAIQIAPDVKPMSSHIFQ